MRFDPMYEHDSASNRDRAVGVTDATRLIVHRSYRSDDQALLASRAFTRRFL